MNMIVYWFEYVSYLFVNEIITVHQDYQTIIKKRIHGAGKRNKRVSVVMNVADERIFNPGKFNGLRPPEGSFTLFHHGLLVRRNGLDLLFESFCELREELPKLKCRVVGHGNLFGWIQEKIGEMNLGDRFQLLPKVEIDKIPAMILQAHCCVVPNRTDGYMMHALNTKILECAAMNVPIIASRTETIAKYFNVNQMEFSEPGNKESLKQCIRRLYNDSHRYKELKKNIRGFNEKFNWKNQKEIYCQIISSFQ